MQLNKFAPNRIETVVILSATAAFKFIWTVGFGYFLTYSYIYWTYILKDTIIIYNRPWRPPNFFAMKQRQLHFFNITIFLKIKALIYNYFDCNKIF